MSEPTADIYRGGTSYPPVDGVSIWPIIINPHQHNRSDAAHKSLWLSNEVLMRGQYKLLVMQPSIEKMEKKDDPIKNGWKQLDESWLNPTDAQCGGCCRHGNRNSPNPCLFDVEADASEKNDLSGQQQALHCIDALFLRSDCIDDVCFLHESSL